MAERHQLCLNLSVVHKEAAQSPRGYTTSMATAEQEQQLLSKADSISVRVQQ